MMTTAVTLIMAKAIRLWDTLTTGIRTMPTRKEPTAEPARAPRAKAIGIFPQEPVGLKADSARKLFPSTFLLTPFGSPW
jgi:hypothetical protein